MIVCHTNHWSMRDIRPCTVKDQHTDRCDGFEYRTRDVWDEAQRRDVPTQVYTGRECGGCLPRKAEHGLLCWHCWEKTLDALKIALDMITHLRSIERAQQLDSAGVRGSSAWILPVPNTWRMADELIMLLGHPEPGFPSDANVWEIDAITERYLDQIDPELWVTREAGAEAAIRFYKLMQVAMAQHPMKEYEHRIRNVRCFKCRQKTLLWKPPLAFEGDVRVECTNPACGAVVDQGMFERLAIVEADIARGKKPVAAMEGSES